MPSAEPMTTAIGATALERNLAALMRGSPDAAARVRLAHPRPDARIIATDDGVPAIELAQGGSTAALCSRRRPLEEARRLMEPIEIAEAAIFVVLGFGAGYHIAELARRVGKSGLIVVFEPDVALLRTALEHVDHSSWLCEANVALLTDPDDAGAIAGTIQGLEGLLALGMKADAISGRGTTPQSSELHDLGIIEIPHPPSRARLGESSARFTVTLTRVAEAARMTVATSLVQVGTTMRNLLMNIDRYAFSPGAAALAGTFAGKPAIVVSAGPSLERNVDLLSAPGIRDRVVIVAVQTALKTLLARGIKPHFVTALDHSDIGTRFYEGLTVADVQGITLIVEPKVNAAIPEAFPGRVICVDDKYLDLLLGEHLTAHRRRGQAVGTVPPGATVAHLAYYLARFLGCEPVATIGQDLGFTDGQYYASGAAIHNTWAGELNEFNTLEMMEWQRIKRMGSHLRRAADSRGQSVYTDEQMNTYRVQFERDFKADADRGLTTFDCTEGGVAKGYARAASLREFLDRFAVSASATSAPHTAPDGFPSRARVQERMRTVRRDIWRIGEASREAAVALSEMSEHHQDQARVNRLIHRVYQLRDEVEKLEPAFTLIQAFNQRGGLDRVKSDRAINLDAALPAMERQRRQIDRDAENVRTLAASADTLGAMLDESIRMLDGGPKHTRGTVAAPRPRAGSASIASTRTKVTAAGLIWLGREHTHWAAQMLPGGASVLGSTVERLSSATELERICILCEDEASARAALKLSTGSAAEIRFIQVPARGGVPEFVRTARFFAANCWRSGLAGATVFDESLAPAAMLQALQELNADAALVVGGTWSLVDPALCDELVRRHAENPESHRFTFSQAAPGLAGCVVSCKLMTELAQLREQAGVLGTLGAMMSYLPPAPIADPIGFPACVTIDPSVRDAGRRFIIDSAASLAAMRSVSETLAGARSTADSAAIVRAASTLSPESDSGPGQVCILLRPDTGRPEQAAPRWRTDLLTRLAALRDDAVITLAGAPRRDHGQPREEVLLDPALPELVRAARSAGCRAVHVRTGLRAGHDQIDALLAANPDIISVDLLAESPGVYGAVAGEDAMALAWSGTEHIIRRRGPWPMGEAQPCAWRGWLVPRMTKCDAAYPEMERFYDRWIMLCGWAVIDPLLAPIHGQRIAPLRTPRSKQVRDARVSMTVQPDGAVLGPDGAVVANVTSEPLADAWAKLLAARRAAGLI